MRASCIVREFWRWTDEVFDSLLVAGGKALAELRGDGSLTVMGFESNAVLSAFCEDDDDPEQGRGRVPSA